MHTLVTSPHRFGLGVRVRVGDCEEKNAKKHWANYTFGIFHRDIRQQFQTQGEIIKRKLTIILRNPENTVQKNGKYFDFGGHLLPQPAVNTKP